MAFIIAIENAADLSPVSRLVIRQSEETVKRVANGLARGLPDCKVRCFRNGKEAVDLDEADARALGRGMSESEIDNVLFMLERVRKLQDNITEDDLGQLLWAARHAFQALAQVRIQRDATQKRLNDLYNQRNAELRAERDRLIKLAQPDPQNGTAVTTPTS